MVEWNNILLVIPFYMIHQLLRTEQYGKIIVY